MIIDKWGKMIILCLDKTINLALCWFRLEESQSFLRWWAMVNSG